MAGFPKMGLVLTGGGARGAYQAGVVSAVAELACELGVQQPFPVLTGISAGSINVGYLATHARDMVKATKRLVGIWEHLSSDQVFKVGGLSLLGIGVRGVLQLISGGILSEKHARALLNTAPLRQLIESNMSVLEIQKNIEQGVVEGVAISALNYSNGVSNTFFQSHKRIEPWIRIRRTSERAQICPDHVMASTAIPLLFPPQKVGDVYFGDGSLRNYTPLSPAIKLGADRLLVVGVRKELEDGVDEEAADPSPGRIFSVLLNSILLDAIDIDYERLCRINQTMDKLKPWAGTELKAVEPLIIRPSEDIGVIATQEAAAMPRLMRYLLRGLGSPEENQGLISYLLFEPAFTKRLTALGRKDVFARREEIQAFFRW